MILQGLNQKTGTDSFPQKQPDRRLRNRQVRKSPEDSRRRRKTPGGRAPRATARWDRPLRWAHRPVGPGGPWLPPSGMFLHRLLGCISALREVGLILRPRLIPQGYINRAPDPRPQGKGVPLQNYKFISETLEDTSEIALKQKTRTSLQFRCKPSLILELEERERRGLRRSSSLSDPLLRLVPVD